ncbi:MAG: PASTA domain-containing protein [Ruminococcaceae bacterium]|nr:PASTA domain-containing protein [Oscillospiraceae bacterium]
MSNIEKNLWPGWETVRLIGRGSFGAVYEIQRQIFDDVEKAALKVITIPQNAGDVDEMFSDGYDAESITATFQAHLKSIVSEYSLMRKMNGSANIVNCDDVRYVQHDDGIGWDIYIKMELLTPLTKALQSEISEETVIRIAQDLCAALILCNKHEIVHRDIKPQNIFISPNGDYKLGDFGIAKTVEKTMGGTKIGTYKYMAPEVYNNQPYGSSADIYSLGLVLYWLLNEHRLPFLPLPPAKLTAGMDEEARHRRLSGETIPAPMHGSDGLKSVVLKACAYDPKDRYASAAAMLDDLNKLTDEAEAIAASFVTEDHQEERQEGDKTTGPVFYRNKEKHDNSDETVGPSFSAKLPPIEKKKAKNPNGTDDESDKKGKKNVLKYVFIALGIVAAIVLLLLLRSCYGEQPNNNPSLEATGTEPTVTETTEATLPEKVFLTVPDVIQDDKELALSKLKEAGLPEPEIIEKHDENVPNGCVIAQSVGAGTQVDEGTKIVLTISTGPAPFDMLDVVGQSKEQAEATLNSKGLVVVIEYKKTDAVAEGNVISQSVPKGTSVKRGDEIMLTVSSGRETIDVANVVGMTQADAERALKAQGFNVTILESYDSNVAAGKVIRQSPGAGTNQLPDSTIVIYVSKGKQPVVVIFDANGGTVTSVSKTGYLSDAYGTLPTPTSTGYSFAGWYSAKTGGVKVTSSTIITTSSNHTLYARWTPNTYSVSFNANGGSGSMTTQTFVYNESQQLSANQFSKSNCAFLGWSTSPTATKATYANNQSISNLIATDNGKVTLYAVWEKVSLSHTSTTLTRMPTGVNLNQSSLTLATIATGNYGKTSTLSATISGYSSPTITLTFSTSSGNAVTWTSSNTNVATVSSSGVVTAKSTGSTIITATTALGAKATCQVYVENGASTIQWGTSNAAVATVSSGTVTAVGKGTTNITATVNGKTATCTVKVGNTYKAIALSNSSSYATLKYNNATRGLFFYNSSKDTSFTFTFVTGSTAPTSGCLYQVYNSNTGIGGQIFFDNGRVAVTQTYSKNSSQQTSTYKLAANTKYTVVVTFKAGGSVGRFYGSIVIKDEHGNTLSTTSCTWHSAGADGTSSAAIGPASILNGDAPNIYLMSIDFKGTNGLAGYGNLIQCAVDFANGSIGTKTFSSGDCAISFGGSGVQYYVQFP